MNVQTKFMLLSAATLLLLTAAILLVANMLINSYMHDFESVKNRDSIRQVRDVIENQLVHLDELILDWSMWDHSYYFVQKPSEAFGTSNFQYEGIKTIGIDFIVYLNRSDSVIAGRHINSMKKKLENASERFNAELVTASKLQSIEGRQLRGVMRLPEGPAFVSSQSILRSDGMGPSMGTLIMGAYLDAEAQGRLTKLFGHPLALHLYEEAVIKDGEVIRDPEAPTITLSYVAHGARAEEFYAINDIYNQPALILQLSVSRDIQIEGRKMLTVMRLSIIAIIMVFYAILISLSSLFWRDACRQIEQLKASAKEIAQGHYETPFRTLTNDEFGELARFLEKMRQQLKASARIKELASKELEKEVRIRTSELQKKNKELEEINSLMVSRELRMAELKKKLDAQ